MSATLPIASLSDSGRAVRDVLLPLVVQGAILRRPTFTRLAERMAADDRALRQVDRLRERYGEGPLLLRLPGRTMALVLSPGHVRRLLDETPAPFSAATTEKTGALSHFQPHGVLITEPPLRDARRRLNERVLDTDQPVHHQAHAMVDVIKQELDGLEATLGWTDFREVWFRIVRRIVLGNQVADDTELIALLDSLRSDANWAGFHPRNKSAQEELHRRLTQYVADAEPGSLVATLDGAADASVDPVGQVPHWLFAFDAAGIALWRLLGLLAARPEYAEPVIAEAQHPMTSPLLAHAGAAVQECVRLWPTTLVVLREGIEPTAWDAGTAPAGTQFAIVSSVFHRDNHALEFANSFEPEIWLDGRSEGEWPLIPFSAGPAVCPGRNLVLLVTSVAVSHLVGGFELEVDPATRAKLAGRMPATFDHTGVRIGFWRRQPEQR
ncbi:cytochrome P450 [Kribbella sp. CA-293567]|uniref:cytochrome P450 n=1 Tax=Kribbella sp. CA-293567 TaxID=3002436 RepID=UPI0022DD1FA1|nr:cytochrome P450 [Kribbella sp. CA-293567]WBQ03496.1 cytochrome P450 [Kribbella sp. CA-293567]